MFVYELTLYVNTFLESTKNLCHAKQQLLGWKKLEKKQQMM